MTAQAAAEQAPIDEDPFADPDHALRLVAPHMRQVPLENLAKLAHMSEGIENLIPLWYGQGDLVTPHFIRDAAKQALDEGFTFYVPRQNGLLELTESLSRYMTRLHGREISNDRITITQGGMQAIFSAIQMVAGPGNRVVYLEPHWPNVKGASRVVGADLQAVRMRVGNDGWYVDLQELMDACTPETKAIFFSSPANPMGWIMPREQQRALLDFCRERGIWILEDAVYDRLVFTGANCAPSLLDLAEPEDPVLAINTFSKTWAMTGWRIGWLTHPPSCAPLLSAITQYTNSGITSFVQKAAVTAVDHGESWVHEVRNRCKHGRDLAVEGLSQIDRAVLPKVPEGGMYVFFRIEGMDDSREACEKILKESGVGLAPGWFFGPGAESFIRLCTFRDPKDIETAMDRLKTLLVS